MRANRTTTDRSRSAQASCKRRAFGPRSRNAAHLNTMVRAPGTVQEDERRVSVVSLRFEGFIDSVENVTTGAHVHKGQTLMRISGPNLSSAAAEYLSALNARPDAGISNASLKGARRRLENLGCPEAFIAAIERTREVPAYVPWPAPQDGEIVERAAVNGMRAAPGDVSVPDLGSRRGLGYGRCRRARSVADRGRAKGQRALRAYPDRRFHRQSRIDLPAFERRRPGPARCESNCQIRTICCGRTCMRMSKSPPGPRSRF